VQIHSSLFASCFSPSLPIDRRHRDNDLTDLFPVAFRNRYQVVVKHSSNLLQADTFDFTRKLAAVERKSEFETSLFSSRLFLLLSFPCFSFLPFRFIVFDSGRSVFRDFEQWKRRKTDQLTNTSLLDTSSTPGRKRRRNEIAKS
jgi:hypothetical protein